MAATPVNGCTWLHHHHQCIRSFGFGGAVAIARVTNDNNTPTTFNKLFSTSSPLHSLQKIVNIPRAVADSNLKDVQWPSPLDEIPFWKRNFPLSNVGSELSIVDRDKDTDLMHVVHVTAEMAPIAKVGGLGDVVTGLARACLSRGHKVFIMLPFYECIRNQPIEELVLLNTYNSYHDGDWVPTKAYQGLVSGIPVIYIEPSNNFFKGKQVYGGSYNELEAYMFFSRTCLEWMQKPRIVLTIHNLEYYGECSQEQLSKCGLDASVYATVDKAVDDRTIGHNPERLCLLKGGVIYNNAVVTVSSTYLQETLCSGWLASTLITSRDKYKGILNGIDTTMWNPATDAFLPAQFNAQKVEGKKICKLFVQRGLGLQSEEKTPLVICITRLVAQKGLHLITHAIKHVEELGGQMIVLGKASDSRVEKEFEDLAHAYNKGNNIRILLMYSEELSHMLYAASDIVLVPSIYEPCGLAQMIGMRYGAVPIVRKTGGLADTVFDVDDHSCADIANGFVFEGIDEGSFSGALDRAFSYYVERPKKWNEIVSKVMGIDNSWNNTAQKYIDVYKSIRV